MFGHFQTAHCAFSSSIFKPTLNVCFLSVSLSSAAEVYGCRTPQPPLHQRNGTGLVWQGEAFYNSIPQCGADKIAVLFENPTLGVDIAHSTLYAKCCRNLIMSYL